MTDKLHLQITTPERVIYADDVDEIVLPTPNGEIGVLPHHIPLMSLLSAGEIRIVRGTDTVLLAVSGGFIEVQPNKVVVLADTAERAEEIDEQRAEEARKRAEALLKEKRVDEQEFVALSAQMEKELARLKVVRKRRHGSKAGLPQ